MGKTTLYRFLLQKLGPEYPSAIVLNPMLAPKQLIRSILRDFGVANISSGTTTEGLIERLIQFLKSENEAGRTPLAVIDEAHQSSESLLALTRILSNYETDRQKLLQVLLVGQPELLRKLQSESLHQLNQRIAVRYFLGRLQKSEIDRYIDYRLVVAGNKDNIHFTTGAYRLIRKCSHGIPRSINQVCDRALLSAFVQEVNTVSRKHVKEAIKSLDGKCKLVPSAPGGSTFEATGSTRRVQFFEGASGPRIGIHI